MAVAADLHPLTATSNVAWAAGSRQGSSRSGLAFPLPGLGEDDSVADLGMPPMVEFNFQQSGHSFGDGSFNSVVTTASYLDALLSLRLCKCCAYLITQCFFLAQAYTDYCTMDLCLFPERLVTVSFVEVFTACYYYYYYYY